MSRAASTPQQQTSRSRIARLKANLGLKQSSVAGTSRQPLRNTDANESEWYIPYNGPYEQPKQPAMGKIGDRDNWADSAHGSERVYDPFERDANASVHGGASTSGHGHAYGYGGSSTHGHTVPSYYEEEHERGRQISPMSRYCESLVSVGGGERRSQVVASPRTSPISPRRRPLPMFVDLDAIGVGIGESPVPMQRVGRSSNSGHGHDHYEQPQAYPWPSSSPVATRDSTSSFWTFGRKKSTSIHNTGGRPSAESRQSAGPRLAVPRVPVVMRDRSTTVTGYSGEPFSTQPLRPRASTVSPSVASTQVVPTTHSASNQPTFHRQYVDDRPESDRTDSPYQRHPYATAVSPTGHRMHSQMARSAEPKRDSPQRRSAAPNLNVPLLSASKSFTSLRNTARSLKASVSTPNLRSDGPRKGDAGGGSSVNSPGAQSSASTGTRWLHPETWCDALLFPRPRFQMRSHAISPPMSPTDRSPPYSAPAQTQSQPRALKRSLLGGKSPPDIQKELQVPSSSAPAIVLPNPEPPLPSAPTQPESGPPQKTLRPPHPKSYAQDDLALPSPVPSLASVLRQNEEFEKERQQWKAHAARSFGNKRSRSLSRPRAKAKARIAGKPSEAESDFAFSFDIIAASAFHGSQTLKPTIHSAPSTNRSGAGSKTGTNTTSTGLNTTSTHSRNTSNASKGGSSTSRSNGQGHARKESWSKTVIRTPKQTGHATGLRADVDNLPPAEEKALALERGLQQGRTKYVHLGSQESKDPGGSNVLVITAQTPQYLNPPQPSAGGPALSPVPSDRSGESTGQSGVGIALSTPTALMDQPFEFTDHPYAAGSNQQNEIPRPAEYAGPHPSRMAEFTLNESSLSDISARHRKPAAALHPRIESPFSHPYAAAEPHSRPTLQVPVVSIPPPKKMFADVGTGSIREVLPEDIQYSPYSAQHSENSKRNSEALGVEEALNLAFSRSDVDNTGTGGQFEGHTGEAEDFGSGTGAQELIVPPVLRSPVELQRGRMPRIDESSMRESNPNSQDDANDGSLVFPTPMSTISFRQGTPPGQVSFESSPMTSPRQFKKFDDMEDYSDLFYQPGQPTVVSAGSNAGDGNNSGSSGGVTPPDDPDRTLTFGEEESGDLHRPVLTRSNSALTNLRKKLNKEYGASIETGHVRGENRSRRYVSDVIEVDEDADDTHAFLSEGSPSGASLPLRLQTTRSESPEPAHGVPEDVESSRASSILERCETEEGTEVHYRVGEVPALATPDPVTLTNIHRVSAHGSYIDTTPQDSHRPLSLDDHERIDHLTRPSLLQPLSATSTTRASYTTSASSASRISQLSEFPVPPGQTTLTPGTIIQSYFVSTPDATERPLSLEDEDEPAERRRQERQARRTTFGPVSDNES